MPENLIQAYSCYSLYKHFYSSEQEQSPDVLRNTLSAQISKIERQILALKKKRSALPSRIKVANLPSDSQFRLETERKILTDTVKIIANRV